FRSSRVRGSAASGAPQPLQNRASSGLSRAHSAQAITRRVYALSAEPTNRVARLGERPDQELGVLLVARLQRQLRLRLEDADVAALAVVLDREDVRAVPGDQPHDVRELAGAVRDQQRDDEVAPGCRHPVADHRTHRGRVDVPAREERTHRPVAGNPAGEDGGHRSGAGALRHELRPLEQQHDRLRDLLVVDDDHLVHQLVEDLPGERAGMLDGDPVGDRGAHRLPPRERRAGCRLDAHDPHLGAERAKRDRGSRREPAAADRDHDRQPAGRQLARELQAERPLPRDDARVLERVHERRARLRLARPCHRDRLVESIARQLDGRPVSARSLDLRHRRRLRDEDRRGDARLARGPGDGLAVVPGARREDAAAALLRRQLRDRVVRAADLERARALQVLGLEQNRASRETRQGFRGVHGRHARDAVQAFLRGADVVDRGTLAHGARSPVTASTTAATAVTGSTSRRWTPSTSARTSSCSRIASRTSRLTRATASASTSPLRLRSRRASSSPRSSSSALRFSSASQSSGTPSPRSASVSRIAGRRSRTGSSATIDRTSWSIVFAAGWSILLTAITSGISMIPALSAWTASPEPGISTSRTTSAMPITSTSLWPVPTVSRKTTSFPDASTSRSAWSVASARSPRSAPRVNGLDGSTEMTPTLLPRLRAWPTSALTRDDLPTPGGPVTPIDAARPVLG